MNVEYDFVFLYYCVSLSFPHFLCHTEGILEEWGKYFADPKEACVGFFFALPYTQSKLFRHFVCLKLIVVHYTTL